MSNSKTNYKTNILISIILSEVLIISAFIFSPKKSLKEETILYEEPVILFNETPQTIQSQPAQIPRPEIPPIYIPDHVEAFNLLEDVNLQSEVSGQNNIVSSEYSDKNNILPLQSAPRLIFEVVPGNGGNEFSGKLQLSLKISQNGRVVDHRILFNSLDCSDCTNDIIRTAYKSKWEPAMINGKNTDYWVVKSYTFN